jgi:hypothetical protein
MAGRRGAFADRRWDVLAAADDEWWSTKSPAERIRIADELRKQVLATRPGWPSPEERQADLETHAKVAEILARALRTG